METTNLSTLKIHKLTEDQYKRELDAGRIDENAIYLTPDSGGSSALTKPVDATSSDGIAYTATVDGLTELYVGCSLMIIPNRESASASGVTLNVNNLGAVGIRRGDSLNTSEWWGFSINAWMKAGYPVRLKYTGTYWIVEGATKPYATDLYGTVPVEKGGTDATTAEAARTNLGAASASDLASLDTRLSALESSVVTTHSGAEAPLPTLGEDGDLYLVTE